MPEVKALPKVLKKWREPVPVRRERFRRAWNEIPAPILHLWWIFGLVCIAGGLGFMWYHKWGIKGERGLLFAIFGGFVLISRLAPAVISRFPGRVTLTENGIVYSIKLLPTEVYWDRSIHAQFGKLDIIERTYTVLNISYDSFSGGTETVILGIPEEEDPGEIRKILEEHGVECEEAK